MSYEDVIETHGIIKEVLANNNFLVELESGVEILCHLSMKLRFTFVRVMVGDNVTVEISPYDLTKGRITYAYK